MVVVTLHIVRGKTVKSNNQLYNVHPSIASVHSLLAFLAEALQLACAEISAELIASNVAITMGMGRIMLPLKTFVLDHRLACGRNFEMWPAIDVQKQEDMHAIDIQKQEGMQFDEKLFIRIHTKILFINKLYY